METNKYSTFFSIVDVIHREKEISDFSKLIFYDIAYLCLFKGVNCYAANNYFAQKYNKSEGTVSKAISSLTDKGFIERYVDQNKNRKIYIKFSKFKNNGHESIHEGFLIENKDSRDILSPDEINLVKDNAAYGYHSINNGKSQPLLSDKMLNCVCKEFKIKDPIKTMSELLLKLLDQYKYYNIKDIERTLINMINRRNIDSIREDVCALYGRAFGYNIVSFNKSNFDQFNVDSLKSTYIPSLAEYLILHLYNLAKEISRALLLPPSVVQEIYTYATDTYEIIWHKLSVGEKIYVKGRLTNINVIDGKDIKMPFAYLKLMNSDHQELTIQVGSKNYESSIQKIHLGKSEDVGIYGAVQYNKKNDLNIVSLYEIEIKYPPGYLGE